jgi:hypothetical protein
VREVKPKTDPTTTTFDAKGSVWRMFRGKVRPRGLEIWHVSGRRMVLHENHRDIVGAWTGTD